VSWRRLRGARSCALMSPPVPGLFVAGDARHGSTKRVAGAVGEGAMAVALAERRLEEIASW
jgi:thioredoxin reductase (NADPH)